MLGIASVHDPRNIILVRSQVKAAFDRFELTIIPQSGEGGSGFLEVRTYIGFVGPAGAGLGGEVEENNAAWQYAEMCWMSSVLMQSPCCDPRFTSSASAAYPLLHIDSRPEAVAADWAAPVHWDR